jgi:hypothetical protein
MGAGGCGDVEAQICGRKNTMPDLKHTVAPPLAIAECLLIQSVCTKDNAGWMNDGT